MSWLGVVDGGTYETGERERPRQKLFLTKKNQRLEERENTEDE